MRTINTLYERLEDSYENIKKYRFLQRNDKTLGELEELKIMTEEIERIIHRKVKEVEYGILRYPFRI
jgi:hypothetical protein